MEEDYANYLIEEHSDTIYDRTVIINPTLKYTRDEFEKHLTTLPPNEVLLLGGSYVKEINYPHLHILVENQNGKKLELGQLPCPSLTLRRHGLLYSKPSTNVFQLLDFKLYKVCANQLSKQ